MQLFKTALASLALALAFTTNAFTTDASAHEFKLGDLEIIHPHSPAMIEGAEVAGGFLTIINHGKTDDRLVSASSDRAHVVQLHEMVMENDVMKMREKADGIAIPAGATVELKHGGLHVMFMHVMQPFKEGEMIKATLTFEKAGKVDVEFAVGPPGKGGDHAMQHKQHAAGADVAQSADPREAIPQVMKAIFETPEKALTVAPVVVSGDVAVAGWLQDGRGGRALLKKGDKGWKIALCSGDSLLKSEELQKAGVSAADADAIAAGLADAEKALDQKTRDLFGSFEGTMKMDGE